MLTTDTPGAQELSIARRAAMPPKDAPYPTLVGTAITGRSTRPPITLGSAPSMPATATITLASLSSSRWASSRCKPATPQSTTRSTRLPRASATSAASSATGRSAVPAAATASSSRASAALSIGPPLEAQEEIRAARLEAAEIHGDVDVAQLTEARQDRLVTPVLPEPRHVLQRDLQPRQAIVVAHAELTEAERADELLGGVDAAQLVGGDRIAVLEARRQARARGLVPGGQPQLVREIADLLLGQARLDQRGAHAALRCRLHPRPVVAEIVHVGAVGQRAQALARGDRRQPGEQLVLAEEAAIGAVARVLGVGQLLGAHDDVAEPDQRGQLARL